MGVLGSGKRGGSSSSSLCSTRLAFRFFGRAAPGGVGRLGVILDFRAIGEPLVSPSPSSSSSSSSSSSTSPCTAAPSAAGYCAAVPRRMTASGLGRLVNLPCRRWCGPRCNVGLSYKASVLGSGFGMHRTLEQRRLANMRRTGRSSPITPTTPPAFSPCQFSSPCSSMRTISPPSWASGLLDGPAAAATGFANSDGSRVSCIRMVSG